MIGLQGWIGFPFELNARKFCGNKRFGTYTDKLIDTAEFIFHDKTTLPLCHHRRCSL